MFKLGFSSFSILPRQHIKIMKQSFSSTALQGPFNYINGERVTSVDSTHDIKVLKPATGEILCTIPNSGRQDVNKAVQAARTAFTQWSALSGLERGRFLISAAQKVRERLDELAKLEVLDTGKPVWEARADLAGCAEHLEYYGGVAATVGGLHYQLPGGNFAVVRREPLGVVGGIGAWNYPFQTICWKATPALACGNTFVYKPSQFTPVTSVVFGEILTEVGVPPGVVNVIQGAASTGEALCQHPDVAKISFTGSVPTGQKIMKASADGMKRVTLELGGKSPMLVFADADLTEAVKATMLGNFLTQGQVCSNCTRVFVERPILKDFQEKLVSACEKMVIGDPLDDETTVGATITPEHAEKVLHYIQEATQQGARLLCGGKRLNLSDPKLAGGYYLSPCVLTDCHDDMTCVKEEIFGSVVTILTFDKEDEGITRANSSPYGLAAGVMTKDIQRANRVSAQLQAGIVWINNYNVFPPEVPFGGYKMSGFGRENGLAALNEYTQLKTVYTEMSSKIDCPIYKE